MNHHVEKSGDYNICFQNTDGSEKTLSFDFINDV